jgi:hypothetical protein
MALRLDQAVGDPIPAASATDARALDLPVRVDARSTFENIETLQNNHET